MMRRMFGDAGARRLWVAAGLSLAVHAAVMISVQRQPGGASALQTGSAATPLMARLASAVSDAVLPVAEPVVPATNDASATAAATPVPPTPAGNSIETAADGTAHYFKAAELERRPFPLSRIEVPPPESADALAGSVMIRLRISESGRVEDAKIVMGTGIAEFEAAALREFSQARFYPGYRNNLPVRSEMVIEVTLRPPTNANGKNPALPAVPPG